MQLKFMVTSLIKILNQHEKAAAKFLILESEFSNALKNKSCFSNIEFIKAQINYYPAFKTVLAFARFYKKQIELLKNCDSYDLVILEPSEADILANYFNVNRTKYDQLQNEILTIQNFIASNKLKNMHI